MSFALSNEQQQANLKSAINLAANQTGVRGPNGEIRSDLSYAQRVAYNKALAEIILEGASLNRFPATAIAAARSVQARGYENLGGLGIGTAAMIFLGEVGSQVSNLNETFNPLAEKNRKMFRNILIIGAVLAAAVYFGPALLQGSRRLKSSFN